jgi:hypothetical protein
MYAYIFKRDELMRNDSDIDPALIVPCCEIGLI